MYTPLLANMGIPMLFGEWLFMALALVPVVVIEAFVVGRCIQLTQGRRFGAIAAANILSTLIGVPIAWAVALAIQFAVTLPLNVSADRWNWQLDSPAANACY
jgi:uncharacterized protein HemY